MYLSRIPFFVFHLAAYLNYGVKLTCVWNDDLEIDGFSPLYATIFLPTMFSCWHMSLQVDTHSYIDLKLVRTNSNYRLLGTSTVDIFHSNDHSCYAPIYLG